MQSNLRSASFARYAAGPLLRLLCLTVLNVAFLAQIARSAPIAPVQGIHVIPIQILNTNSGRVMTAHAHRYDNKVYIDGLVYRPSSPGIGPHVHVWGVNENNHTVFFKTASVMVTGKPSFIRSESYVVSVSPSVFNKAKVIYVTFHSQSDAESIKGD